MTDQTPAALLRAAAAKIRADAAAAHRASPAPWRITDEHAIRCADGMIVADRSGTDHPAERADLPYIAAMHPGVGEALADWLEAEARLHECDPRLGCADCIDTPHALAVARRIVGSES